MLSREWQGPDKARTQILSKRSSLELGVRESRKGKEVSRKRGSDVASKKLLVAKWLKYLKNGDE